jgi:hypothetical protein
MLTRALICLMLTENERNIRPLRQTREKHWMRYTKGRFLATIRNANVFLWNVLARPQRLALSCGTSHKLLFVSLAFVVIIKAGFIHYQSVITAGRNFAWMNAGKFHKTICKNCLRALARCWTPSQVLQWCLTNPSKLRIYPCKIPTVITEALKVYCNKFNINIVTVKCGCTDKTIINHHMYVVNRIKYGLCWLHEK